ncbi:MAG: dihydroorotate dehydrogenase [Candidatus Aenigmarchaeota archaeon]|nr:dihydroorotate dehydrogenase [Candidatus Aenigmarchaeota archaeon]
MADIRIELLGMKLRNPTILASGIVGSTKASVAFAAANGAGAVTIKSVTRDRRDGFANPTIITFEAGMLNAVGYSNPGAKQAAMEFADLSDIPVPVIGSLTGTKTEDFVYVMQQLKGCPFAAIEMPLSCPHTPGFGTMAGQHSPEATKEITKAVVKETKLPVIVKLSPVIQEIADVAKAAEKAGAAAINMGNTAGPGMIINTGLKKPVLSGTAGGISGPALRPLAVRCVYDIYKAVKIPIIGTGGVMTGNDAIEMLMAGAQAVGIGTAIHYRGIDVFNKVSKEIAQFMDQEGYRSIKEMVGAAHA